MKAIEIGQIVISIAGRDKDEYYVVIDVKDDMAYVVNGLNRKLDYPKPKRFKHLQPTNMIDKELALKLKQQLRVTNLEIRQVLNEWQESRTEKTENH